MLIAALSVLCAPLYANEEDTLQEAPKEVIEQALQACRSFAVEDEVMSEDLNAYLLDCVNDELEANDYKKIAQLPKK